MTVRPVVTFGELLLRLSPPGDERWLQSPAFAAYVGGCEANVAAGLAQCGVPTRYCSRVPDSPIGEAALRPLRAEGVDVSTVTRGGARLGLYYLERGADLRPLRAVYDRAGSAFATASPADFAIHTALEGAGWFHSSGIVPALGAAAAETLLGALAAARAAQIVTSLDCNYRPALWTGRDPQPVITPLLPLVDCLIGNPGAFATMLGVPTEGTPPERPEALLATARRLHAQWGTRRIAITQRQVVDASTHEWCAWLWQADEDRLHDGGSYRVRVVDRVGGGDAFAAVLIAGLHRGLAPADTIRLATAAGAHKLTVPGDFPRVQWSELEALVASRGGA